MKKNNIKKLLAVLLGALMILSVMIPVSAAGYDATDATSFVFSDSGITVSEGAYDGYKIDGTSLSIKSAGTYVVSGSCNSGTIVIKKNVTGVTLILDGLTLSASATAPITCNKGSEVTIVAAAGTVNDLFDDKYNNDDIYTDETLYPDIENAVIKCKDGSNVTICGTGTINITSNGKNGVKGGYDLYEEDGDGNATDTLLNILSGNIAVNAADDGVKSDYVLNIGEEGTDGPTLNVIKSKEGVEAATLNVYSGRVTVNATDDGINAANADLSGYNFSYNQYGGYVYVNVTNGDGVDSNGTINLYGGTLEVYSPSAGDGDPLDADGGTSFDGATVLAVGHLGMSQGYGSTTPYVVFGGTAGGMGGMGVFGRTGGMMSAGTNLVTAGSTIEITDESGKVLYTAKAPRDASYILFASPELTSGATYTLKNGGTSAATATAGTASTGGMGGMNGQMPDGNGFDGQFPGQNGGQNQMPGDKGGQFPGRNGEQGQFPTAPDNGGAEPPALPDGETPMFPGENGTPPALPDGGFERETRPDERNANEDRPEAPDTTDEETAPEPEESAEPHVSWFTRVINAIKNFFISIFKR